MPRWHAVVMILIAMQQIAAGSEYSVEPELEFLEAPDAAHAKANKLAIADPAAQGLLKGKPLFPATSRILGDPNTDVAMTPSVASGSEDPPQTETKDFSAKIYADAEKAKHREDARLMPSGTPGLEHEHEGEEDEENDHDGSFSHGMDNGVTGTPRQLPKLDISKAQAKAQEDSDDTEEANDEAKDDAEVPPDSSDSSDSSQEDASQSKDDEPWAAPEAHGSVGTAAERYEYEDNRNDVFKNHRDLSAAVKAAGEALKKSRKSRMEHGKYDPDQEAHINAVDAKDQSKKKKEQKLKDQREADREADYSSIAHAVKTILKNPPSPALPARTNTGKVLSNHVEGEKNMEKMGRQKTETSRRATPSARRALDGLRNTEESGIDPMGPQ